MIIHCFNTTHLNKQLILKLNNEEDADRNHSTRFSLQDVCLTGWLTSRLNNLEEYERLGMLIE